MFCHQQVADLARHADRFRTKNLDLVVIGSGEPSRFKMFRKKTGYKGLLFTDPSLRSFSVLHLSKNLKGIISAKNLFKAAAALQQGYRQGSMQGSTLQLGGAAIIDTSGTIRYYYAASTAGDQPDINELSRLSHQHFTCSP
ncbi:MAG: hypothetical protein CSA20_08565 [Deltaproteobacteria bacterium]|nr:MAG: hypothetical protein CSA20_08565 [Deltaproteobacteria bacterium]